MLSLLDLFKSCICTRLWYCPFTFTFAPPRHSPLSTQILRLRIERLLTEKLNKKSYLHEYLVLNQYNITRRWFLWKRIERGSVPTLRELLGVNGYSIQFTRNTRWPNLKPQTPFRLPYKRVTWNRVISTLVCTYTFFSWTLTRHQGY